MSIYDSIKKAITFPLIGIGLMSLVSGCANEYGVYKNHPVSFDRFGFNCTISVYSNEKRKERMTANVDCKTGKAFTITLNSKVSDLEEFATPQELKEIFDTFRPGDKK